MGYVYGNKTYVAAAVKKQKWQKHLTLTYFWVSIWQNKVTFTIFRHFMDQLIDNNNNLQIWSDAVTANLCELLLLCRPQAPAAFGLVSFLMHAGLERNRIRKHLLVFALAAPVLAMLTFLGLSQVNIKTNPSTVPWPCQGFKWDLLRGKWSLSLESHFVSSAGCKYDTVTT